MKKSDKFQKDKNFQKIKIFYLRKKTHVTD